MAKDAVKAEAEAEDEIEVKVKIEIKDEGYIFMRGDAVGYYFEYWSMTSDMLRLQTSQKTWWRVYIIQSSCGRYMPFG